ncbi:galactose-specific lectin nattectin-like [Nematolebias whitei]|uniref:galactose-specific lectin nattectin-like n=1 Tax=Nematolebias whitei TaxID=451745 RepID=UPI0018981CBC|nr:galactose-specific lectin nattectin-like [Nematolebias whitei]
MASAVVFTLLLVLSCGLLDEADAGCSRPGGSPCSCPSGWTRHGKRCFLFMRHQYDWASSERTCHRLGGNLASFHSRSDYDFLRNLAYRATGYHPRTWVGASDAVQEGFWMWSDGSRFDYVSWGRGEPNNAGGRENCMEINLFGGDYTNDMSCSMRNNFICAKAL